MTAPLAHLVAAAKARHTASPANSLTRKASGCALVVLKEARTVKGALRMLGASTLPDEIRDATADLIHQLDTNTKETIR